MSKYEIYVAADHHGVELKDAISQYLLMYGYTVHDLGTNDATPVDYPHFAEKVARQVSDSPDHRRGILLCGSGIGMCMVANRFPHILAGAVWNEDMAARAGAEDNINVLCLGADYLSEEESLTFVEIWLTSAFSGDDDDLRRLDQIAKLDKKS